HLRLYATDFHHAKVDVFDSSFNPVVVPGNFDDPNLPAGFAPFGIANIHGLLFVTFAMQDADAHDDLASPGAGLVDVFTPDGVLLRRLISPGGQLNSPWGLALAPDEFGPFSHKLIVGNFGDGAINAYSLPTGAFVGQMKDKNGDPIIIE